MMRCEVRRLETGGGVDCRVATMRASAFLACLPFNHTAAEVERGRQRESEGEEWEMTTVEGVVVV